MKNVENLDVPAVFNMFGRTGKPVANQFVVVTPEGCLFQSYKSRICYYNVDGNELYFGSNWNYSRTTSKYLGQFLRVYAPRWYARIMKYGKRTLAGNIQQAIIDGIVMFVPEW